MTESYEKVFKNEAIFTIYGNLIRAQKNKTKKQGIRHRPNVLIKLCDFQREFQIDYEFLNWWNMERETGPKQHIKHNIISINSIVWKKHNKNSRDGRRAAGYLSREQLQWKYHLLNSEGNSQKTKREKTKHSKCQREEENLHLQINGRNNIK